MRDKYNLNTLPKGQEDAADYGIYFTLHLLWHFLHYIILFPVSYSGISKAVNFIFLPYSWIFLKEK